MFSHLLLFIALVALSLRTTEAGRKGCPVHSVCFAIDVSASQSTSDLKNELNAVKSIATKIGQAPVKPRYSAYSFASNAKLIQSPTVNLFEFKDSIDGVTTTPRGSTNIHMGIKKCYDTLRYAPGKRVIVLLTDGFKTAGPNANNLAGPLRYADIKLVTVGIGSDVNDNFLRNIAYRPEFYFRTTFSTIVRDARAIANKCFTAACIRPKVPIWCKSAFYVCRFKFQGVSSVPLVDISFTPDRAITPKIVSKDSRERLGILNTNGMLVDFVHQNGGSSKITQFGRPRMTPTHFKPFRIGKSPYNSGVGHQTFTGNQFRVSRHRCVRIFFTQYQTLTSTNPPYVKNNVNASKRDNKCVVFYTY